MECEKNKRGPKSFKQYELKSFDVNCFLVQQDNVIKK